MSLSVSSVNRRTVLGVVTAGNFVQLGARFVMGPVVPLMLTDFDASAASVGFALTAMWATYALFQFPSGVLADRYGERRLLLLGLFGTVVGAWLVALSPSLALYGVAVVVLGAGTGLFFSPASSFLSRAFDSHGSALSALTAGGAVAGVVYPAGAGFVGVQYGWRTAVAGASIVAVPALLATAWILPRTPAATPERGLDELFNVWRGGRLLSRPSVLYTTVLAVIVGFTFQAVTSFLPTFLVQHRALSPGLAGAVFALVFGLSALAQPAAGRLSDAVSRDVAIATSVTLTAAGIATLLSAGGTVGLVSGTALLGAGISWPGTIQARFMDQLTDDERGFGFGLVRTVYLLLAASGSVVVGSLVDAHGWTVAYGVVILLLCCCLFVLGVNRALSLEL